MFPPNARTRTAAAACTTLALAAVALAGCGPAQQRSGSHVTIVTVTVTPSSTPVPTTSAPASTSAPTRAVHMTRLPGTCTDLLPTGGLINALGHPIPDTTSFIVGIAEPDIGRLQSLDCRYGLTDGGRSADIEIGIGLYATPARAAARIAPTVADFAAHGATSTAATVGGVPATLLRGGSGAGYEPTLVLATGQRTVAVTMRPNAFPADSLTKDLTTLAQLAVTQTQPT